MKNGCKNKEENEKEGDKERIRKEKEEIINLLNKTSKEIDFIIFKCISSQDKKLQKLLNYYISGKEYRLRSLLIKLSCKISGGYFKNIMEVAAAFELLHLSTFIIDDILDNSKKRYGKKSFHEKFGLEKAIITAEILKSLASDTLISACKKSKFNPKKSLVIIKIFEYMFRIVYSGQYLDLLHSKNKKVTVKEYLDRTYRITGCQMEACVKIGALFGDANEKQIRSLSEFGKNFGIAFQINDDIEDLTHDTGKSSYNDLKEGKITLPIIHALSKLKNKKPIYSILGNKNISEKQFEKLLKLLNKTKSIGYSKKVADEFMNKSINSLKDFSKSKIKENLINLARYINEI